MSKQALAPRNRRRFANAWAELDYLCDKIRFWLFTRGQPSRAERFQHRLARTLRARPDDHTAILRAEGLALLHQLKGDLRAAITYREREIQLMERLHEEANTERYSPEVKAYMLRDRGPAELKKRRLLLKTLRQSQLTRE